MVQGVKDNIGCISFFGVIALCVSIVIFGIVRCAQREIQLDSLVGRRCLVNKDTLILVKRSDMGDYFILSNGIRIDEDLAEKSILK